MHKFDKCGVLSRNRSSSFLRGDARLVESGTSCTVAEHVSLFSQVEYTKAFGPCASSQMESDYLRYVEMHTDHTPRV
jgi:hypothetical protein